jgi:hypothetical protein
MRKLYKHSGFSDPLSFIAMVKLPATATFEGKNVKVEVKDLSDPPQVIGTFTGKFNHVLNGTNPFLECMRVYDS